MYPVLVDAGPSATKKAYILDAFSRSTLHEPLHCASPQSLGDTLDALRTSRMGPHKDRVAATNFRVAYGKSMLGP
jgi:hypothetical protein